MIFTAAEAVRAISIVAGNILVLEQLSTFKHTACETYYRADTSSRGV